MSYKDLKKYQLLGCNLVMIYPNVDMEKYFEALGFQVYSDVRLSKNSLVFSTDKILLWLFDDNRLQFDFDIPIKRFLFFF